MDLCNYKNYNVSFIFKTKVTGHSLSSRASWKYVSSSKAKGGLLRGGRAKNSTVSSNYIVCSTNQRPDQYKIKILVFSIQYDFQILKYQYQYSIWRILTKYQYQYAEKTEVSVFSISILSEKMLHLKGEKLVSQDCIE